MDDNEIIGANVRRLRKAAELSQSGLAEAMRARGHEWHQNTVSRVETGKQDLRIDENDDLAEVLNGNVLAGTDIAAALSRLGAGMESGWLLHRVRNAERAMEAAAGELAELRKFLEARHNREAAN